MRKRNRKENGITLIALVITIIVLLILAGITINLTIGQDGIIRRAQEAGKNYLNAAEYENSQLSELTGTADNIISNIIGENGSNEESGGTTPSTPETIIIDVNTLKAGDYIKYDSGTNGVITCRVLYPTSSEYGLQIISDKTVKNVTLGSDTYSEAVTSYNNAIETLNNEAEAYINSEYAYDARCVGSLPTVVNGMFTKKDSGATEYVTLPFTNANYINSLDGDSNYETDTAQLEIVGINKAGWYWLASRTVNSGSSYCGFRVNAVNSNGSFGSNYYLCDIESNDKAVGHSHDLGLRPCISLKTDIIKIIGGDGKSEDTAYVIGK